MSELQDLLDRLRADGGQLWVHEGRLRFRRDGGATPEQLAVLRRHRSELVDLLERERVTPGTPLAEVVRPAFPPLSYAQEGLWFLDQLEAVGPAYNVVTTVRIEGDLDVGALRRSVDEIVRRHEILRTRFRSVDGVPVQAVQPPGPARFETVDLSGLDEATRAGRLAEKTRHHAEAGFAIDEECPFVVELVCLAPARYLLVVKAHHLLIDAASSNLFFRELRVLYEACLAGEPSPLPELSAQYADYAVWQRQWLEETALAEHLGYWRRRLADAPASTELPLDRPRPSVPDFRGAQEAVESSPDLSAALEELGRRHGASPFMVLLAAYQVLLARWSGQHDLCVGVVVDGRAHHDAGDLIGCFVNTVVVRADLSGDPSFTDVLAQTRDRLLEAYDHRHVPVHRLVAELGPERGGSHQQLFQTLFAYMAQAELGLADLRLTEEESDATAAKFDLSLFLAETPDGLRGGFEYATSLFDRRTITRLTERFALLLRGVVAAPDLPIGRLPMLLEEERHEQLVTWNATGTSGADETCLHELFERQAAARPDATAVVFDGRELSYAELDARADRVAARLGHLGVGPESLVAVCAERSPELVAALLGVLKAGGAYVPLDPSFPPDRLAYMVADSGTGVLLTQRRLMADLRDMCSAQDVTVLALDDDVAAETEAGAPPRPSGAVPANAAYMIYTSGSTGRPKGVVNTHRGIVAHLTWMGDTFGLGPGDAMLQKTPISFDVSVCEMFWPLSKGARLVLATPGAHRDPVHLRRLIEEEKITTAHFIPSMLPSFLAGLDEGSCPSLRRVICSGEELPVSLAERVFEHLDCELHNLYGPTEAAVHVSAWQAGPDEPGRMPIGRPVRDTRFYVLDDRMEPVPVGTPGHLHIGGVQVARCYHARPGLTAERFVPDPYGPPGSRLYQSGDLARLRPDGVVEFLGRIDHQVKIRGYRIELGEIENALARCEGIDDAVVIAREDTPGDQRLVAYLVGDRQALPRVRRHLRQVLPAYMLPAAYVFLAELPLTAGGKTDRRSLPAPPAGDGDTGTDFVAPRTQVEVLLAEIWREVLNVERISVHDDFFALGGHSLLATRVVARIRQRLGLDIPLHVFFAGPTIAGLARTTASARAADDEPIRERRGTETVAATLAQQRIWFLDQLDPGSTQYTIPLIWRLRGTLDLPALGTALDEIVRRHEALRTTFVPHDGIPFLIVDEHASCPLTVTDLPDTADTADRVRELIERFTRTGFDLESGPLIRAALIRSAADDHVLAIAVHHIAADGWSLDVLADEFAALYAAYASGRRSPLPDLPVRYSDYAAWQHGYLGEDTLAEHLDYWRGRLEGAPRTIDLPTDRPRPAQPSHLGAHVDFTVGAETADRLRALGERFHATSFMTLASAFGVLLHRLSGQDDLCLGYFTGNRDRPETEGLIGLFVNTLVLRSRVASRDSFEDVLGRVHAAVLDAHRHRELPFERLVDELRLERDLSLHPVFQVAFSHHAASTSTGGARQAAPPGLDMEPMEPGEATAKFDLTLLVSDDDREHGLRCRFEYATDLFDRETVAGFARHFRVLLDELAADPGARVADLPLLPASDRGALVRPADVAVERRRTTIPALFAEQAARTPDAEAVAGPAGAGGSARLTYRELNARANRLARHLIARGAAPERHVALILPRTTDLVVAILAVLKTGAAYVPIDPDHPADRIAHLLRDARPVHIVATSGTAPPGHAATLVDDVDLARYGTGDPAAVVAPDNAAYVIYTSGSTGRPKGVVVSHQNVVRLLDSTRDLFRFGTGDIWTLFHSYAFDFSVWELWGALLHGGRLVVVPTAVSRSPEDLLALLRAEGVTVLNQTPSAFYQLIAACRGEFGGAVPTGDLALRYVIFGGEALDHGRLADWYAERGDDAPHLVNMYGITETTVHASHLPLDRSSAAAYRSSVIGTALPDLRLHVLDEAMRPVPPRVAGEIHVGGPGLARGYLDRPGLTAERFVPDPYGPPGSRLYRSGDLARLRPDGMIEFLGRIDHQVKIRAHRIEPGEIEAALRRCPGVADAAVVAREDTPGDQRLVAYLTGTPESRPREHLQRLLPGYMLPSAYVRLPELPRTSNDKVARSALPAPVAEDLAAEPGLVPPRTPVEKDLAAIWRELLNVERVGVHDGFFDLGGHSLLATRVVARIRRHWGCDLPLHLLFTAPTIAELGREIEERVAGVPRQVERSERGKAGPWFKELTSGNAGTLLYVIPAAGMGPGAFRGWRGGVPPDVDVVVIHTPGREERLDEPPYTRVGPLADRVAEAIREHADRPFIIFGHSAGALIGREVAERVTPRLLAVAAAVPPNLFEDMSATDDELLAALAEWGTVPEDLLDDPEVRSVFLPALRADLAVAGSCRTPDVAQVDAPVIAFTGSQDISVPYEDCAAWAGWTSGPFEIHTLDGGHFFPLEQGAVLLGHITAMAARLR